MYQIKLKKYQSQNDRAFMMRDKIVGVVVTCVLHVNFMLATVFFMFMSLDVEAQSLDTQRFKVSQEEWHRPDFTLQTVDGEPRSIGEWDGQVILIDFWASWCIPCRREMPIFNELREIYGEQGFEVIGLAADELDKVKQFITEVKIDFPIIYGDIFDVMDISKEYGNYFGGLPFSAFIDRNGNIRFTQKPGEVSFEEAEEILKRLL